MPVTLNVSAHERKHSQSPTHGRPSSVYCPAPLHALLRAMESHAVHAGLSEIHLSSTATAKAFYLRNGFVQSGPPEVEFGIQGFPLVKQFGSNNPFNGT